MFTTTGTIVYKGFSQRWVLLELDHEIGQYFRKLYEIHFYRCHRLQRPKNKEHVTVVREEFVEKWKYKAGATLEVEIHNEVLYTNGNALWFNIQSLALEKFRAELGLSLKPPVDFHFCIGYTSSNEEYLTHEVKQQATPVI